MEIRQSFFRTAIAILGVSMAVARAAATAAGLPRTKMNDWNHA
jgi:hypothetical protein